MARILEGTKICGGGLRRFDKASDIEMVLLAFEAKGDSESIKAVHLGSGCRWTGHNLIGSGWVLENQRVYGVRRNRGGELLVAMGDSKPWQETVNVTGIRSVTTTGPVEFNGVDNSVAPVTK